MTSVTSVRGAEPVTIVGAGIAGAACAAALSAAGRRVRVIERGRAPGGRMASPRLGDRPVDVGAGYFTVRDNGFESVVRDWAATGTARPWTDTFGVLAPGLAPETTTGPVRWATPEGLRALVRALLTGIDVRYAETVNELPDGDVVLAMPDPQASRLTVVPDAVEYHPVIAVVCEFAVRDWPFEHAAFVHDHPDVEFLADDGDRRGDGAPVLVAHTTAALARRHLADAAGAIEPVVAALRELLRAPAPVLTHARRWTFAKPADRHEVGFGLIERDGRRIGLAGDQWCPAGSPRVESAWRSGTDLAAALVGGGA